MMRPRVQIAPSLLSADFACLKEELQRLKEAGADRLHLDVMDGHFVPNITFGPLVIKSLRPHTDLIFEAHLMIAPYAPYLEAFAEAGADIILIHPEASPDLKEGLHTIKALGKKAGVVLNPETPTSVLTDVLNDVDQVLIMTVNPGFGGQSFMQDQLEKIKNVRALFGTRPIDLEVDGGITPLTAPLCIAAGATVLVAGTAVFQTPDFKSNIVALRGEHLG
jgi:ribulose-phosphate 3-epimerase